jgi:hypothetical protein
MYQKEVVGVILLYLNIRTPTENENDDIIDSCYEELQHVFGQFAKYCTKFW